MSDMKCIKCGREMWHVIGEGCSCVPECTKKPTLRDVLSDEEREMVICSIKFYRKWCLQGDKYVKASNLIKKLEE